MKEAYVIDLSAKDAQKKLRYLQRAEITGYHTYKRLAKTMKDKKNAKTLNRIAEDELLHYKFWIGVTGVETKPSKWQIFKYYWIARILGITFGVKLMERGEDRTIDAYSGLIDAIPNIKKILQDEERHEKALLNMLEEERLQYVSSIVLGLNDALVEFTGAIAGYTLALPDTRTIALTGLITGVAASLSMASSEYLSSKSEQDDGEKKQKNAFKAALATGTAYIITVILLVLPYFFLKERFVALAIMIATVVVVIAAFNYYISVAKDYNFRKRFFEMAAISLGVAAISFGIGVLINLAFGT